MPSLAVRNLIHDKVRLFITLTGIVFSVVLSSIQLGLFIGFLDSSSNIIAASNADIWITSKDVPHVEVGTAFSEKKLYQALSVPGVEKAGKYIIIFRQWQCKNGGQETILLIGFEPKDNLASPWNIVEGSTSELLSNDTVAIDTLSKGKLQIDKIGEIAEIQGHRAKVVSFTEGIRSFTTFPVVFTSFKNALNYAQLPEDQTINVLIKVADNYDVQDVKARLSSTLSGVNIYSRAEYVRKNQVYWLLETGAGISVIMSAVLGLVVGAVVVSQTIYATTVDHIKEFATLKAIGASNGYIYKIIISQAAISAVVGYSQGIFFALMAEQQSKQSSAEIVLPWEIVLALFLLTLFICIFVSIFSIRKVMTVDPVMVFKG